MRVFKFMDKTDGNLAFVLGTSKAQARTHLYKKTALMFEYVDCKSIEEIKIPYIIKNEILPF